MSWRNNPDYDQEEIPPLDDPNDYLNPDIMLHHTPYDTQVVFIYLLDQKRLIYHHGPYTHHELSQRKGTGVAGGLSGRIGTPPELNQQIVSFWATSPQFADSMITACLKELYKAKLITPNTVLHYPTNWGHTVADYYQQHNINPSPDRTKQAALARQAHILTGRAKQAATKQLGGGGDSPHYRGSQYWNTRQTSESRFERQLNHILQDSF